MSFATSAALQDFRSLILGNHPLNLEQQVVLWRLSYFPVQEEHFNTGTKELFQQEHLMGVVACQPIRTMHIELINASSRCHITQTFEGRTNERGSTVAVIDELQFRRKRSSRRRNTGSQIRNLTLNRFGLTLLVSRDTSIEGGLCWFHWAFLSALVCAGFTVACMCCRRRRAVGMRQA